MGERSPQVPTEGLEGCQAASVLWRRGAETRLTAVAKVSLRLVPNGTAAPVGPAKLQPEEREHPPGYLWSAGELAPLLPKADVLVVGHASAVSAQAGSQRARLGYWRGSSILLDKTVPLPAADQDQPLLRGLGPIPGRAPERAQYLGGHPLPDPSQSPLELPGELRKEFFQAAPADQQLSTILSGDGLLLDGLLPEASRLATQLPELRGYAMLRGPSARDQGELVFRIRPDTLVVDLDQRLCHVVLRGHCALVGAPHAHRLAVSVQVQAVADPAADEAEQHTQALEALTLRVARVEPKSPPPPEPQAGEAATMRFDQLHLSALGSPSDREPDVDAPESPTMRLSRRQALEALPPPKPPPHKPAPPRPPAPKSDRPAAGPAEVDLSQTVALAGEGLPGAMSPLASAFDQDLPRTAPPPPPKAPSAPPESGAAISAPLEDPVAGATTLASTAAVDADELLQLRSAFATPFERAAAEGTTAKVPPPSTPPEPPPPTSSLERTASVDGLELERLRSAFATPFDRPPPASAAPAEPPRRAGSAPPPSPQALERTASVDSLELERLRSAFATPFDRAAAQGQSSEVPGPSTPPADRLGPSASEVPPSDSLGQTAAVDEDELERLRAQHATPFGADPSPGTEVDAEPDSDSLGAAFLGALDELEG